MCLSVFLLIRMFWEDSARFFARQYQGPTYIFLRQDDCHIFHHLRVWLVNGLRECRRFRGPGKFDIWSMHCNT